MEKLKVASFFCGCGGMDLGLQGGFIYNHKRYAKLPFEITYSCDNDPYCTQIYNSNFQCKCEVKDVRELNIKSLPAFNMLIGGFPCQSFSISAQNPPRLGYKDVRGMLFFEMVKALRERHPRFFIAENVKGLLSANQHKAFPMILKEFEDSGYYVKYKLFNASDYGVPQKRERIIMIGFHDYNDFMSFEFPEPLKEKVPLSVAIDASADNDEKWIFSQKAVDGMLRVRAKMNKGRAQNRNEPCNTISSHLAKVSLNSTDPVLMVGEKYRRFTPREAARIQSFPDSFDISSVSECRQYRAIGNAVPPVLMWNIANCLSRIMKNNDSEQKSTIQNTLIYEPGKIAQRA